MEYVIPGITKFVTIPQIFYSDATKQKFSFCLECNKFLLHPNTDYLIQKVIKKYKSYAASDTLIEYAMCMDCESKLKEMYSHTSYERLNNYFEENMQVEQRLELLHESKSDNVDQLLSTCMLKNTPVAELEEYQLFAMCRGEQLIVHITPFMIGEPALDEMTELLSNKTIGAFDDFVGKYFGLPPEFEDIRKRLLFI